MASTQVATYGLLSTISSWFSRDLSEKQSAKVVFNGSKITDSIYDLRPQEEQVEDFCVEIVFFHGLQMDMNKLKDGYFMTWISDTDPPKCWPAVLLPKLFPKARLLSVRYDGLAKKTNTTSRDDIDNVAENFVMELIRSNRPFGAGVGQTRAPVIFVTHCLGALVAQKILLEVDKQLSYRPDDLKLKNFWNNFGGVVYFSPPLDQFAKAAACIDMKGPLGKFLQVLSKDSARISQDFSSLLDSGRFEPKPPSLVICGSSTTTPGGLDGQVVEEGLSRLWYRFVTVEGDHFSVAQPEDETSQSFEHLANFVEDARRRYVSSVPRTRGGDAGSSPLKRQLERRISGAVPELFVTEVHVDGGQNILSSGKETPSKLLPNDWLPINPATRTTSWVNSSALTFFSSYDDAAMLGGTYSR
ncbi:hypothetical protein R1flu_026424 [Riccia fluitans]|uniref:Uncharacterized protein n=1 Tax=Riccia fluitans TaxID=41844 RepID=A0ABD1XFY1_9MARC